MTTREEAVREAIEDAFLDRSYDVWPDMVRETDAALAAADAHDAAHGIHRVSLDDATVERAARAMHDSTVSVDGPGFEEATAKTQEHFRLIARVVLHVVMKESDHV